MAKKTTTETKVEKAVVPNPKLKELEETVLKLKAENKRLRDRDSESRKKVRVLKEEVKSLGLFRRT